MQSIEALAYLDSLHRPVMKLGLSEITELLNRFGNPQDQLKIIHVAGTNGKGSVCQFIRSILQERGKTVGVFSSPHLLKVNECLRINDEDISDQELSSYINRAKEVIDHLHKEGIYPSSFEVLTAIAFLYFYEKKVDFVVLEVGLGGRQDATNVIKQSLVSVFTKISIDHVDFLGDTLEKITWQKAGIIKEEGTVITPVQEDEVMKVLKEACINKRAELLTLDPSQITNIKVSEEGTSFVLEGEAYHLQMLGPHQAYNCSIAVKVAKWLSQRGLLELTDEDIKQGVFKTKWEGRFEKISDKPKFFVDGAHNVDGIKALAKTMDYLKSPYKTGIVGILKDKEVDEMIQIIAPKFDTLIVTKPNNPRASEPHQLADKIRKYHLDVKETESIKEAVQTALSLNEKHPEALIIAFGSLYMLGEIRSLFL